MDEAAEALDLMNNQYQLQHLDIKPQNLFLVYQHVKVADFGLVKDLEGMQASVTGGVTPVYAAPETFDGWVSRFSDQYSLAICYQELLTGQRPFSGDQCSPADPATSSSRAQRRAAAAGRSGGHRQGAGQEPGRPPSDLSGDGPSCCVVRRL